MSARLLSVAGATALSLALVACAHERSDGRSAERAQRAETEFNRFGQGRYRVITFSGDAERMVELSDDYHLAIPLYEVPFAARVEFTGDLDVLSRQQWRSRVGTAGWTVDRMMDDVQLTMLFAPGHHAAGEQVDVEGAVMFDRLENGWRFRGLDIVR